MRARITQLLSGIIAFLMAITAFAVPNDSYLFIEVEKQVDEDFFRIDPERGRLIIRDYSGSYRFENHRLSYHWDGEYNPFETPFELNRLIAMVGYKGRHLYPVHDTPFETKLVKGVPAVEYIGINDPEPHLDVFQLLQLDDSGNAEMSFAGQTFQLAIGESKEFVRKVAHLPDPERTDEWYRDLYENVAVAGYVIKDKVTNHGWAKKEGFVHQIQPTSDGERIAYVSNRNGKGDIFLYDLERNTEQQITTTDADPWQPMLSDDWLIWLDKRDRERERKHFWDIYAHDLSTGVTSLATEVVGYIDRSQMAADGDWLAYKTERQMPQISDAYEDIVASMAYITLLNLRTGEKCVLTESAHMHSPIFFKDNQLIWEEDERGAPGYYAYNPVTTLRQVLPLVLDVKERKSFREHGLAFLWKRENPWCHVPVDRIVAIDGTRILWSDLRENGFRIYLDTQDTKAWQPIADSVYDGYTSKPEAVFAGQFIVWTQKQRNGAPRILIRDLNAQKARPLMSGEAEHR